MECFFPILCPKQQPQAFNPKSSAKWSPGFAFDDSGEWPFAVEVTARPVPSWGYWKGSEITDPPPVSPVSPDGCGAPTKLRLVPFGSTNIRIAVFPWTKATTSDQAAALREA